MRAIALAIVLAGMGIEYAILKAHRVPRDHVMLAAIVGLITLIALVTCLVMGL